MACFRRDWACPVRFDPNNRSLIASMAAAPIRIVFRPIALVLLPISCQKGLFLQYLPSFAANTPFGGIFVRKPRLFAAQPALIGAERFWRYREMSDKLSRILEVSLVHHQSPCGFGKQAELPKNFGFGQCFFVDGSAHCAAYRHLFSKAPVSSQSAHYTGVSTALIDWIPGFY